MPFTTNKKPITYYDYVTYTIVMNDKLEIHYKNLTPTYPFSKGPHVYFCHSEIMYLHSFH